MLSALLNPCGDTLPDKSAAVASEVDIQNNTMVKMNGNLLFNGILLFLPGPGGDYYIFAVPFFYPGQGFYKWPVNQFCFSHRLIIRVFNFKLKV